MDLIGAGLCASCRFAESVVTKRGSVFLRCRRSETDPRYPRYPRLPVLACPGHEPGGQDEGPGRIPRP